MAIKNKLYIECACGKELSYKLKSDTITIFPCGDCLKSQYDEGAADTKRELEEGPVD